jgi:deoxyribonuclease V
MTMKAALDVHYEADRAAAACMIFQDWQDSAPIKLVRVVLPLAVQYRAGRFYERELPCLLAVLRDANQEFEAILIDGFVHLRVGKGLGAHLFEALDYPTTVIGVAKSLLGLADNYVPILRGQSSKPLYISAAGCPVEEAALLVQCMHGPHRIPTLLKIADRYSRGPMLNLKERHEEISE